MQGYRRRLGVRTTAELALLVNLPQRRLDALAWGEGPPLTADEMATFERVIAERTGL